MAAALLLGASIPTPSGAASCSETLPSRLPVYSVNGSWTEDGSRVLLVDPTLNELFIYDREGRYQGRLPESVRMLQNYFPAAIDLQGSSLLVELANRRYVRLDSRFQIEERRTLAPRRQIAPGALESAPKASDLELESAFMWESGGSSLIACSDLLARGEQVATTETWLSGVVRVPWSDPEAFEVLHASAFDRPEWLFCRLGFDYLSWDGEVGFVYLFGDAPGVFRIQAGSPSLTRLGELPPDLAERPELAEFTTIDEYADVMRQVERSSMVTGLHRWGDRLFLVHRKAPIDGSAGAPSWSLHQIDPETGERKDSAEIVSDAPHLMVLPGRDAWLIVEKESVEFLGNQPIRSFLLLDSVALDGDLPERICD